jgi:hypothetical protein
MQDAGRKTSEKDRCIEYLQDFKEKPLFDTRFMMFNTRYMDDTHAPGVAQHSPFRLSGRMYYILMVGTPIKCFADISKENPGDAKREEQIFF